ncbi:MAG TPA: amidase [Smithellaceae bacterium]|nr:amidase [Smithellaceae bacterium]HRS88242.1 amidase [Smithellaceae bacterium]HRV25650.1 amidase [Smithellaceae bacterium]
MKGFAQLKFLDATALAGLVKNKKVKAKELVETTIEHIEKLNPQLNAVVTPMYDEAMKAAKGKIPAGPFAGVPFLVKDLVASCKGVRMTFGTKNMKNYVPDHDSELVRRYRKAGFIIVGKTNTPELGLTPVTESKFLGPCRNPWDTNRTPGGSSGGSAAAVAAGIVPAAHGNDGGGSIRIPASCCGLFGLKPTRARNSLAPDVGDAMSGLVCEHVLTRSVRDSAAILDATRGYVPGDPYMAPEPVRPYAEEVKKKPGRLRIAYFAQTLDGEEIHADCAKALEDAARLCRKLGHKLTQKSPIVDRKILGRAFNVIWAANCAATIDWIAEISGRKPNHEDYEPLTWALYEQGKKFTSGDYLTAVEKIQGISRGVARFFMDFDIFMTPTLGEPPLTIGELDATPDDPLKGWRRSAKFVPFTPLCNATGQPAMSVPLCWNEQNLPIGIQFVGRYGDEATLFRLAAQLEKARPWAQRIPYVSV